jgi:radical SAM superfamily enzyme YgiQ (UPF0313 family)
MRVLLVAPEYDPPVGASARGQARAKPLLPPLSLLQVAALTPPSIEVEVLDESSRPVDFSAGFDLVGVTATTAAAPRAYEIADGFRRRGRPVVMGGMHASACPEEALAHCDAVVIGEAEGKWERLLSDLQQGRMERLYRADEYPDMAAVPSPRRELLPRENYVVPDTVQATRGCAHNCSFCSVTPFFGRHIRARPAEAVAEDFASLPGRYVLFVDDNIMTRPTYAQRLFEGMMGTGKKWVGQASTAVLQDARLLKLAAQSGCELIFIGLESLSTGALQQVNKSFNAASKFRGLISRLHDIGIGVIGAFMFGFDEDDDSVFERTAEFADKAKIDVPQYSILTPLPGTLLYRQMEEEGRIIDRDWSHYDGCHVVFAPRRLSADTLQQGMREALQRSYSRLSILKRLFGFSERLLDMLIINREFRRRVVGYLRSPMP